MTVKLSGSLLLTHRAPEGIAAIWCGVRRLTPTPTPSMTARKKKAKAGNAAAAAPAKSVASAAALKAAASKKEKCGRSLDEELAAAGAAAEAGMLDDAADGFARAVALAPRRVDILDALAEASMEAGRPDEARTALRRSIELAPQAGFEKYMYLSQMLGGCMEAVEVARAGVDVLRREKAAAAGAPGDAAELRRAELVGFEVSALCGLAEVLLTVIEESQDQAVADRLDAQVELAIGEALAVSVAGTEGEMEAAMALANLRLSQARRDDARSAMERVAAAMAPGLDTLDSVEEEGDDAIVRGIALLPPMPLRVAVGKQLIEVGLWEDAVRVLSSVLHECDFNIEVWYMLALAFQRGGDSEQAAAALVRLRETLASPDGFDGQVVDGAVEQLDAVIKGTTPDTARRRAGESSGGGGSNRGNVGSGGGGSVDGDDGCDDGDATMKD